MARIDLMDTPLISILKMAEGNPGAIAALTQLMKDSPSIDPQCAFGPIGPMLTLDTSEIYGSGIYILWNDKCNRNSRKMCLLLRALQLGLFHESKLRQLAADQMRQIDISDDEWQEIDDGVCSKLDEFQKA